MTPYLFSDNGWPVPSADPGLPAPPERSVADLGLMLAALAAQGESERRSAGELRTRLLENFGPEGNLPPYIYAYPPEIPPLTQGTFGLYAHLWALLGMSCTFEGVPQAQRAALLALTGNGAILFDTARSWGTFEYGDGTTWGQQERAYLMKESALAGLILFNEGLRLQDTALLEAAHLLAVAIPQLFRSADGTYRTAVSHGVAASAPDGEAFALAGLLSLRFSLHAQTAELLDNVERTAASRRTPLGTASGYHGLSGVTLNVRDSVLVTTFLMAASRLGLARSVYRGLEPLRLPSDHGVLLQGETRNYAASLALDAAHLPLFLRHNTAVTPAPVFGPSA